MHRPSPSSTPAITRVSFCSPAHLVWLSSDDTLRHWRPQSHLSAPCPIPPSTLLAASVFHVTLSDQASSRVRHYHPDTLVLHHVTHHQQTPSHNADTCAVVVAVSPTVHPSPSSAAVYAVYHAPHLCIHDYSSRALVALPHEKPPLVAAFDVSLSILLTADADGRLRIFSSARSSSQPPTILRPHKRPVLCLQASHHYAVAASMDGFISFIRLHTPVPTVAAVLRPDPHPHIQRAVAIEQHVVAAGGNAKRLHVWLLPSSTSQHHLKPRLLIRYDNLSDTITALAISQDLATIAVGCADSTVRLFTLPSTIPSPTLTLPPSQHTSSFSIPLPHVVPTQKLIFAPSHHISLLCPICQHPYDPAQRLPISSAVCAHTFACALCAVTLTNPRDKHHDHRPPVCPVCRVALTDVTPNYELLRILNPINHNQQQKQQQPSDFVDVRRLAWQEDNQDTILAKLHACTIVSATLDGEIVALRLPLPSHRVAPSAWFRTSADAVDLETNRHIARLRALHCPQIVQLYGVSRVPHVGSSSSSSSSITISELPIGGMLSDNLARYRQSDIHLTLPIHTVLALALQLLRIVRTLHEADVTVGYAMSPRGIALSAALSPEWGLRGERAKLMELGGSASKSDLDITSWSLLPTHFVAYAAPEALDAWSCDNQQLGHSPVQPGRPFERACLADLYSVGVVIWSIASLKVPFDGMTATQIVAAVVGRGETPGDMPTYLPSQLKTLVLRLCDSNPSNRPLAASACQMLETIPTAPPIAPGDVLHVEQNSEVGSPASSFLDFGYPE